MEPASAKLPVRLEGRVAPSPAPSDGDRRSRRRAEGGDGCAFIDERNQTLRSTAPPQMDSSATCRYMGGDIHRNPSHTPQLCTPVSVCVCVHARACVHASELKSELFIAKTEMLINIPLEQRLIDHSPLIAVCLCLEKSGTHAQKHTPA